MGNGGFLGLLAFDLGVGGENTSGMRYDRLDVCA